jgi:hypothetical protein
VDLVAREHLADVKRKLADVSALRRELESMIGQSTGCWFLKAVEFDCKPPWSWVFCWRQRIG